MSMNELDAITKSEMYLNAAKENALAKQTKDNYSLQTRKRVAEVCEYYDNLVKQARKEGARERINREIQFLTEYIELAFPALQPLKRRIRDLKEKELEKEKGTK